MKLFIKKYFKTVVEIYYWFLPRIGALLYGFPARKMTVILVTGTKGKTSTTEIMASIIRASGHKVALTNSVRFVIDTEETRNTMRMSMPGKFFLASFLKKALRAGCTHAVIEATSEGARQFRHHALSPNALIFTNLAPEHIESHGSMEHYTNAKLSIADELQRSSKRPRVLIVNGDDPYAKDFIEHAPVETVLQYSPKQVTELQTSEAGSTFVSEGTRFQTKLPGVFNVYNILGCITLARALKFSENAIATGVFKCDYIAGRGEFIKDEPPQAFDVVVDYAHTPESLEALYQTFSKKHIIAVMGATGGGRDKEKRPRMGAMAEKYTQEIILTDEDPYDENPDEIVAGVAKGILHAKPTVIMDRAEAILEGVRRARMHGDNAAVLITGKGTDPCICRANGTKELWSDADVARSALKATRPVK
jgi:UDP-N-acetylmuramoyl-L-alanyl-D-glutamate--2,6-diaminopimelate ligase